MKGEEVGEGEQREEGEDGEWVKGKISREEGRWVKGERGKREEGTRGRWGGG